LLPVLLQKIVYRVGYVGQHFWVKRLLAGQNRSGFSESGDSVSQPLRPGAVVWNDLGHCYASLRYYYATPGFHQPDDFAETRFRLIDRVFHIPEW
jgi:hypothetical protein